jgi:hypothetical protein
VSSQLPLMSPHSNEHSVSMLAIGTGNTLITVTNSKNVPSVAKMPRIGNSVPSAPRLSPRFDAYSATRTAGEPELAPYANSPLRGGA